MKTEVFYNKISPFYPFINFFLKSGHKELIEEINNLPSGSLLEIAIGHGKYVAKYKGHKVTGVDSSAKMLSVAKRNTSRKTKLFLIDADDLLTLAQKYDYIVISHFAGIHKNPNKLLKTIHRLLNEKGKLIILNHFTPDNSIRLFDYIAKPISKLFHFNSYFKLSSLSALKHFRLLKKRKLGSLGYYQLLILEKSD